MGKDRFWKQVYPHRAQELVNQWRANTLANIVESHNIGSVLDIGCSTGAALFEVAKRCPGVKLCGIDISEGAIGIANQRAKRIGANIGFVCGRDKEELPKIEDKGFDLVFTAGTLIYKNIKVDPDIIGSICRVARKFIIHIERCGREREYQANKGGAAMFQNDFRRHYIRLNQNKFHSIDLSQVLLDNPNIGSAKDFMWVTLGDEELNLKIPETFR